jgi:hypothetical protein
MATKRRLHVWEHPHLHPAELKKQRIPVHIIFDDDEYDYWEISPFDGALCIGLIFEINRNNLPSYKEGDPIRKEVRYRVSAGMFAKVQEVYYEDEPEVEVPLYNADEDPDFVGRERFENQRLAPHVPLVLPEPHVAVDTGIEEPETHTVVMSAIPADKVDTGTGVNLTHIAEQVNNTRLDLMSPLMMLPLVGQQKVSSAEPLSERTDKKPETPPAAGSQKDSE